MKFYTSHFVILALFACGEKSDKPSESPGTVVSKASLASVDWVKISISLTLLREDFNRQQPPGIASDDYCFRLGHIIGRAKILGDLIKESLLNDQSISDVKRTEITTQIVSIQGHDFSSSCSDASLNNDFHGALTNLAYLISSF